MASAYRCPCGWEINPTEGSGTGQAQVCPYCGRPVPGDQGRGVAVFLVAGFGGISLWAVARCARALWSAPWDAPALKLLAAACGLGVWGACVFFLARLAYRRGGGGRSG